MYIFGRNYQEMRSLNGIRTRLQRNIFEDKTEAGEYSNIIKFRILYKKR